MRKYLSDNMENMTDYVKLIISKKPDLIFVHFGTNDIKAGKDTEKISKKSLACSNLIHRIQRS